MYGKVKNTIWHKNIVNKRDKESLLAQKSCVLWFTGLSGSGKSTIATALEKKIFENGKLTVFLDGDNIRQGLCSDLGFSIKDRKENLRRIREIVKLFYDSGIITLVSFISPFKEDRNQARTLIGKDFIEIFIDCDIEECKKRDPKGLYKKVKNGEIEDFTGISQKYEKPENPEIIINSNNTSIDEAVNIILEYLDKRF